MPVASFHPVTSSCEPMSTSDGSAVLYQIVAHIVPSTAPTAPAGHVAHACPFQYSSVVHVEHDVIVAAPPTLNDPEGHVAHACPSQNSSALQDVHDVSVAAPPTLNDPEGHVTQADPSQYSSVAHHHLYVLQSNALDWLMLPSGT